MDIKLIFIVVILLVCLSYYWQRKIFSPFFCQDIFFFTSNRVSLISKTEARNRMRIIQTGMPTMAEKLHAIKTYCFRILWEPVVKMDELVTWFDILGLLNRGSIHIIKDESSGIPCFKEQSKIRSTSVRYAEERNSSRQFFGHTEFERRKQQIHL
jgi:hypothetical protein